MEPALVYLGERRPSLRGKSPCIQSRANFCGDARQIVLVMLKKKYVICIYGDTQQAES